MSMRIQGPSAAPFAKPSPRFSGENLDKLRNNLEKLRLERDRLQQEQIKKLFKDPIVTVGGKTITGREFVLAIQDQIADWDAQRGPLSKFIIPKGRMPESSFWHYLLNGKKITQDEQVSLDMALINIANAGIIQYQKGYLGHGALFSLTPAAEKALADSTPKSDR